MIYAWVLVVLAFSNSSMTVSGIASEQECHRLGDAMQADRWIKTAFECHRYLIAR